MNAGYLVVRWVQNKMKSVGKSQTQAQLAGMVGSFLANFIMKKVTGMGVTGAATAIATAIGKGGSIAGPLGVIIGGATGYF